MIRALSVGLIAVVASVDGFVALAPAAPRAVRSAEVAFTRPPSYVQGDEDPVDLVTSVAGTRVQMVTSPRVSSPPSRTDLPAPQEPIYTAKLQEMENEAMADLEQTFGEIAAKAKAESEAIWTELNKEIQDVVEDD